MIVIAAGSSLPFCGIDSQLIVSGAFSALEKLVTVEQIAPFYETPAWPEPSDPAFINTVAIISTGLSPAALLASLHAIEAGFGRRRRLKNAPRPLDLDLIAYHDVISTDDALKLPHPGLEEREFVLAPLCDLVPDWRSPPTGKTARAMLDALPVRSARRIS